MTSTVGVTVEIAQPGLLPELLGRLSAHGCMARAIDERACRVVHVDAIDAAEEWYELRFFLRAWEAAHGVEVSLRPDWQRAPDGPDSA
jgi:hypothetical protein